MKLSANQSTPAEWRQFDSEFPAYEASRDGRIRSSGARYHNHERTLHKSNSRGHLKVMLYSHQKFRGWWVHRAVCTAFNGPAPANHDAAHINGDPSDNRAENLYWATRTQNQADKRKHGTDTRGERGAWLHTAVDVERIRDLRSCGVSYSHIAKQVNCSMGYAHGIIHRKYWADHT